MLDAGPSLVSVAVGWAHDDANTSATMVHPARLTRSECPKGQPLSSHDVEDGAWTIFTRLRTLSGSATDERSRPSHHCGMPPELSVNRARGRD
jgi:hypothetical protein